jgi:hypothetical protein
LFDDLPLKMAAQNPEIGIAPYRSFAVFKLARAERSELDPKLHPYQDLIDQLVYRMGGLTGAEIACLDERYEKML